MKRWEPVRGVQRPCGQRELGEIKELKESWCERSQPELRRPWLCREAGSWVGASQGSSVVVDHCRFESLRSDTSPDPGWKDHSGWVVAARVGAGWPMWYEMMAAWARVVVVERICWIWRCENSVIVLVWVLGDRRLVVLLRSWVMELSSETRSCGWGPLRNSSGGLLPQSSAARCPGSCYAQLPRFYRWGA